MNIVLGVDARRQMEARALVSDPARLQVGDGFVEFQPSPAENRRLVRTQYTVPATLLVKFQDDAIDESAEMAALLRQVQPMGAALSADFSVTGRIGRIACLRLTAVLAGPADRRYRRCVYRQHAMELDD